MPSPLTAPQELRAGALALLRLSDPVEKSRAVQATWAVAQEAAPRTQATTAPTPQALPQPGTRLASMWRLDTERQFDEPPDLPGRPALPRLVSAKQVPTRSVYTPAGRAALLHAIAHIEFNAINLALDAVWRFAGMPADFYRDWWQVAAEEALHFGLLRAHLHSLGQDYGDFDAHDGLWNMCSKTRDDIVARMALVPRTLEARGLDATPLIQAKLTAAGDLRAVHILDIILRDEVGHVAIGNRWFHALCKQRGLDPAALYPELVARYEAPRLKPPFNIDARRAAGFSEAELIWLTQAL